MSKLFESTEINGMVLKNRFVRSATWEGMAAEDGSCTPKLVGMMRELARGKVGLIVTSHAYVQKNGQAGPWQLAVYQDEYIPKLTEMTDRVHAKGGKIVIHLAHAGFFANPKLIGETPAGSSAATGFTKTPRVEMTERNIQDVVKAFGLAAKRAQKAGFDGLQIHAAHGYLLSQFLSPAFNKRQDRYGGNIENRVRILKEVLGSIRKYVGKIIRC